MLEEFMNIMTDESVNGFNNEELNIEVKNLIDGLQLFPSFTVEEFSNHNITLEALEFEGVNFFDFFRCESLTIRSFCDTIF